MSKCKTHGEIYVEFDGNTGLPEEGYCYQCEIETLRNQRDELVKALESQIKAMELTRQYVGYDMLPARRGWSWFDAEVAARELLNKIKESKIC